MFTMIIEQKGYGGEPGVLNTGDILFQLFSIIILASIIIMIISLFRSRKQRREQLNRMEKRIEELSEELKRKYLEIS